MSILNDLCGEPQEEALEGDPKLLIPKGEVKMVFSPQIQSRTSLYLE